MVQLYKDDTQFILFPAIGFAFDENHVWLTIAFAIWGISFLLYGTDDEETDEN